MSAVEQPNAHAGAYLFVVTSDLPATLVTRDVSRFHRILAWQARATAPAAAFDAVSLAVLDRLSFYNIACTTADLLHSISSLVSPEDYAVLHIDGLASQQLVNISLLSSQDLVDELVLTPDVTADALAPRSNRHRPRRDGSPHTTAPCFPKMVYRASPWERAWLQSMVEHERNKQFQGVTPRGHGWRGCGHWTATNSSERSNVLLGDVAALSNRSDAPWSSDVLSYFERHDCTGSPMPPVPIEPLVGLLRHPLFNCINTRSVTLNKDAWLVPTWRLHISPPPRRALLFDLGASSYSSKDRGGNSQAWMTARYASGGLRFDRVIAWEARLLRPSDIFAGMPRELSDHLSYFNVPLDVTPGARHNPMRMLAAIARPEDYVVFKIDFDHTPLEEAIMEQAIQHAQLIDELYFEHHVVDHPLVTAGWRSSLHGTNSTVLRSHGLFGRLREAGIRAHSWV